MINDLIEETYYRGEFLGSYANSLVSYGLGTLRRGKYETQYRFTHMFFDKLSMTVEESEGLPHSFSYDVTLRGPKEQVEEFKTRAKNNLESEIHSLECFKKQLLKRSKPPSVA